MSFYFQGSFDSKNQRHIQRHSWEQLNYLYQLKLRVRVSEFPDNAEANVIVLNFLFLSNQVLTIVNHMSCTISPVNMHLCTIFPFFCTAYCSSYSPRFCNLEVLEQLYMVSALLILCLARCTNYSTRLLAIHICKDLFSILILSVKQFCSLAYVPELL